MRFRYSTRRYTAAALQTSRRLPNTSLGGSAPSKRPTYEKIPLEETMSDQSIWLHNDLANEAKELLDEMRQYQSIDITYVEGIYYVSLNVRTQTFPFPAPKATHGEGETIEEAFRDAVRNVDNSVPIF